MKEIHEANFSRNEATNLKIQSFFNNCDKGFLEFPGLFTLDRMGIKKEPKVTLKIIFKKSY